MLKLFRIGTKEQSFRNFERFSTNYFTDEPELFRFSTKDAEDQIKFEMDRRYKGKNFIFRNIKPPKKNMKSVPALYTSQLSGEQHSIEEFTHNNMKPFFGGRVKQNMNIDLHSSKLENFTGVMKEVCNKDSERCFTDVHKNVNDYDPAYLTQFNRMEAPRSRNNIQPSEQIMVGPGFNPDNKFEALPSGGLNQTELAYAANMYKDVDALRVQTNPKTTYEGVVIDGSRELQRGLPSTLSKNKVETFYEKNSENLFKTVGAYTKQSMKPCVDLKSTTRQKTTTEYKGTAYNKKDEYIVPESAPLKKSLLESFGVRNAANTKKKSTKDHGKNSFLTKQNSRDITHKKTRLANVTAMVKSLITPIQDVLRPSQREYMTNTARTFPGNINGPNRATVYDPNGVARTTIKELHIHDNTSGNLKVNSSSVVYDPSDVAKTTAKEVLKNYWNDINLKGSSKPIVFDPDDKTKTTVRETTENQDHMGHISNKENFNSGYQNASHDAKSTSKEVTSLNDYYGQPEMENGDGYKTSKFNAKNTYKEFLSDNEYVGNSIKDVSNHESYESAYNATINELNEQLLEGRSPTNSSVKIMNQNVNPTKERNDCALVSARKVHNFSGSKNTPIKEFVNIRSSTNPADIESDRLDASMVESIDKQLENNPYVQSIVN